MQALIQGVLEYSRVDSPVDSFFPADCERLIASVLANLRAQLHDREAQVTYENLPVIYGAERKLGQLF